MFPMRETTLKFVFAVVHTISNESPAFVVVIEPPTPLVVNEEAMRILCPTPWVTVTWFAEFKL